LEVDNCLVPKMRTFFLAIPAMEIDDDIITI